VTVRNPWGLTDPQKWNSSGHGEVTMSLERFKARFMEIEVEKS